MNTFISRFFGFIFLQRIPDIKKNIYAALQTICPNLNQRRYKSLYIANLCYIAELFYYMIFILPHLSQKNIKKYINYKNFERLNKALAQGKGVIIPGLHTGNITHFIASLVFNDNNYEIVVLAEFTMIRIFRNLIVRPENPNVHLIGSRKFANVRDKIVEHLKKNHIVFIFYDYTSRTQLRLPFSKKLNFLKPTPQSVAALHLETGSPILPGISYPNKSFKYSTVEILDNSSIMAISKKFQRSEIKKFHSLLSLEINRVLHPYIRKFLHMWEEIINFGYKINTNFIKIAAGSQITEFLDIIHSKILDIINNSYEPNRLDEEISRVINSYFYQIYGKLRDPDRILSPRNSRIKIKPTNGKGEILELCLILLKELENEQDFIALNLVKEMMKKIETLFF